MRLNIAKSKGQEIEGYHNILAEEKDVVENIEKVINNSCVEVLCLNSLENLSFGVGMDVFSRLLSKVRNNGTLKIAGLDFKSLCNSFLTGKVSSQDVNEALSSLNTVYDQHEIVRHLEQNSFVIETLGLKGQTFQLEAKRVKNNA